MRALLLLTLLCSACGDGFPPASFVDGLRLLGMRADPPEAAPGQTVALTAWAVDTQQRAINLQWAACLAPPDPGMGTINNDCLTTDMSTFLTALGSGAMISTVVPAVPATALLPPDITGGQYLPIRLSVTAQSDDDSGVYRLRLKGTMAPNHNPTLASVDVITESNGKVITRQSLDATTPLTIHSGETLILRAEFTSDSAEAYQALNGDGTLRSTTETLTAQWFSTGGSLDNETSGADVDETFRTNKRLPPPGTVIDLWVVAHDERGGSDMMHRQLLLQ